MKTRLFISILTAVTLGGCMASPNVNQDVSLKTDSAPTIEPTVAPTAAPQATSTASAIPQRDTLAEIVTSKGTIKVKLYGKATPNTVKNFLTKAASGYYQGLTFHRVEDWVIQGGDPKGNGTGGGSMPTELSQEPFKVGSLGVARGGNVQISNDSQFFICTADCSWLTGQYTNFGEVVSGMDVAKKMAIGDKIVKITETK